MNRSFWSLLVGALEVVACATCLAPAATASPVAYTINFTATSGSAPASGQFSYDSAQPAGSKFSSFAVVSDGITFNLTPSANNPSFSNPGGTCSNDVFNFLSTGSACATHATGYPLWFVGAGGPAEQVFAFSDVSANGVNGLSISADVQGLPEGVLRASGRGTWTITAASTSATPEPASLMLVLAGGTLLLLRKRRYRAPNCPRSTGRARHLLP